MNLGELYLQSASKNFSNYKNSGDKCFAQLNDEEMHFKPDQESNSIAIIIQHLSGNMQSRWSNFLTEDGEKEWRKRDDEFEAHSFNKQQLINLWDDGWTMLFNSLNALEGSDLVKTIFIRSEPHTVIDAINRQLTHIAAHTGQIIYLAKHIRSAEWKTLSIPKNGSALFNEKMMGRK